jgi:hypothetical protein
MNKELGFGAAALAVFAIFGGHALGACGNDGSNKDAGPADGAAACATDVSSFSPAWVGPNNQNPACQPAEIDVLLKQCTETTACSPMPGGDGGMLSAACTKCLLPPDGKLVPGVDPAGPIGAPPDPKNIGRPTRANLPGCVALLDPASVDCARTLAAYQDCIDAACASCADADGCATTEGPMRCTKFAPTADCTKKVMTGAAQICVSSTQRNLQLKLISTAFCGP